MLDLDVYINDRRIGALHIWNTGTYSKTRGFLYHCYKYDLDHNTRSDLVEIWHKREDGWEALVVKALRKLKCVTSAKK